MEKEESLHSVFVELKTLRKKLADIEQQKEIAKKKQFVTKIDGKLEQFSTLLKAINEHQENINKTAIVCKLPEKNLGVNNSLQLAYTHHDAFMNITLSKPKIEKLIQDCTTTEDKTSNLKMILNELKNINSTRRTQFFEQLCEYRSAKGLLDNIEHLKEIDKCNEADDDTTLDDKKDDSDLGCYPNESPEKASTKSSIATNLFSN